MRSVCLGLIMILVFVFAANAEIINIPEDFETIQAGIDATEDGDTVLVQPGIYIGQVRFDSRDITVGSLFLTTRDEAYVDSTIIDGDGEGNIVLFRRGLGNPVIAGFTVRNCYCGERGGAIFCESASPIISNVKIIDCEGQRMGLAIYLLNSSAEIDDCVFADNNTSGFLFYFMGRLGVNRVIMRNCSIFNNIINTLFLGNFPVSFISTTIVNNQGESTMFDNGRMIFSNCILRGNVVPEGNVSVDAQIEVSYSNIEGGQDAFGGDRIEWGEGNIDTDPLFADPDEDDYHLTADSPCIDTGDPEFDIDPDGTRTDMGAFYFHQRDVAVEPLELNFPPIGWGQLDSMSFTISNDGLTDLTIESIMGCRCGGCFWMNEFDPDLWEPIVIESQHNVQLWVYYRPEEGVNRERTIYIRSDDPDEPEVFVQATGEVNVIGDMDTSVPLSLRLNPPYPNPFNSTTTVGFLMSLQSHVSIEIYNIEGQLVDVLLDQVMPAGKHNVEWNANGQSAGVYFVKLKNNIVSQKENIQNVIVLK